MLSRALTMQMVRLAMDNAKIVRRGKGHAFITNARPLEAPLNTLLSFWPNVLGERKSGHAISN